MARILVSIEKEIELGAKDALHWLTGAGKSTHTAPAVIAALAVMAEALEKPLLEPERLSNFRGVLSSAKGDFFLRKKPLDSGAFPLHQLESRYSRRGSQPAQHSPRH